LRPRELFAGDLPDLRPDFGEDLEDFDAFDDDLPDAFAEDFDADFDEDPRAVFAGDFLLEAFAGDLREAAPRSEAVVLVVREAAFDVREAAFDVRAAVETAFSIAAFEPDGPSVAGPGRIMSPAAGLTALTAPAAVSRAAFASPAACSPACPISLEAVSTAPPRTPRATSSTPPPLFFLAIFTSVE
jgi:hypothetical protein